MSYLADYFIKSLDMTSHPEGGYFKESFVSDSKLAPNTLHINEERYLWTSIYFLLRTGEVSNFHRLKSDEMWYFHAGEPLTIYMISPEGELIEKQLGLNIEKGESPQVLVPKDYIFGSSMNRKGFSLVGCMVAPGFNFKDFELFEREDLLKKYPKHKEIIEKLTR
ncbi:cupin domain-containing protein [Clostridium sp. LIBA-8841]|uniref:cupin domain-containing protein n=1 Tax=Clostridium sp. LIBA-8841 TaxID=2987530 RepID=UPI002AC65872|nr:cupin domain-containing protein [Clostridium sp. LIBA-8841]MDZ5252859.1 cupin domain-containing protein [Clostridium sp. LIBA-8841]